jgi:two-component system, NtrC family, response regulator AtoC
MQIELTSSDRSELLGNCGIVWGHSPALQAIRHMAIELSATDMAFLLLGETGTGKEFYAKVIHKLFGGETREFKKISCPGISVLHLQEEIRKLQEIAENSDKICTLFLDEIDGMTLECQRFLLPLILNGTLVGLTGSRVHVISSASQDLGEEVKEGRFRRDLYFRLNVACLRLPPLRERMEDLLPLLHLFLRKHAEDLGRDVPEVNQETMEVLLSYHWPGNIRELENVARKMVALGETQLAIADLRACRMSLHQGETGPGRLSSLKIAAKEASRQTEKELILQALARTKWNRKRAARELQISYKSLLYKLKQIETLGSKSEK